MYISIYKKNILKKRTNSKDFSVAVNKLDKLRKYTISMNK